MRVLVLGGNGFIGSHLVDKLLEEGHYVRVFDRSEEHYRKPLSSVEYILAEFGNRGLLAESLEGIDIVFHLISSTLPKTSNDDPVFDIQSNVVETLFLLEQCVLIKIKKIIFISSGGCVYGYPQSLPVKEDHQTDPICSYGIGKLAIEKYLYLYKKLYNLDYTILRVSNPFGSRQNPFGTQGVISVFLGKVSKNECIQIWGDGRVVRDYLYIDDLVEALIIAVNRNTTDHIFNIGSGDGKSINEIIIAIKSVTGCDFKVIYKDSRACDIPKIYLDISKVSNELNWHPKTSMEKGVEKTWEFIKSI